MKLRCDICGTENSSCNQYVTRIGKGITICPACLAWSNDPIAKAARQAHNEGRLIKPEKGAKKK